MNPFTMDPSKMDPKVLMELSQMIQQLPPDKLTRMQSIMHNMMAGFDVKAELEEFEKSLPPGFRERLMSVMAPQAPAFELPPAEMDMRQARLTLLQGVAQGRITPEQAEKLLFPA